ncbi:MAG TPA: CHAT domain-containing tetratricopeptide repeat protein [Thermoanaerobaculia bacterium]|nr:CHAT domain-containing tetratricopeptide repeat protein [Thermoanaerobaculia bacterium]
MPPQLAAIALATFLSYFTDANPPAAFNAVVHRYECVTLIGARVDNVTTSGDEATAELTAAAVAELPLSRAQREFPPHWTLHLRRDGDTWRVKDVTVPEAAFAEAFVKLETPLQRMRALSEHGELVDAEFCRRMLDIANDANRHGDYHRGADIAEIALAIAADSAPTEMARAQWLIGRAHDSAGDEEGAAGPAAEALRLAVAWNDRDMESRALVLGGWVASASQRTLAAAPGLFRKGIALADALHDDQIASEAYLGLGYWSKDGVDDFVGALRNFDLAKQRAQRAGDRLIEAAATGNIGSTFDSMSNYVQATTNLRRAIELYREVGNTRGVIRNMRNLADVEHSDEHFDVAERLVHEIDELLAKTPNPRTAAFNDLTGAKVLLSRHHPAAGEARARKALAYAEKAHDEQLISHSQFVIGTALFDQHRYAEAVELMEKIAVRSQTIQPDFGLYWHSKTIAGRALRKLGKTDEARTAFLEAIAAIEKRRASLTGSGNDEVNFFSDKIGPYLDMAALAIRRHDVAEAVNWLESEQARTLLDSLAAGKVHSVHSLTPEEREAEQKAEARVIALNLSLREARSQEQPDRNAIASLDRQLLEARAAQEALTSQLYLRHPELSLARGHVTPVTLAEVQRGIPRDGVVLDYANMENETWLLAIAREGKPHVYRIPVEGLKLQTLSAKLERLVASGDLGYATAARRMYDLLIAPAAADLQGKKIVCIVPGMFTWGVPFQAMVDPEGRHFVERHSLFYAPSLTLLSWYSRHPRKETGQPRSVLAVGNPRLTGETVQMAKAVVRDESVAPLPDAEREARRIAAMFQPRTALVLTGARATEMRVKQEAGRYRVLHFATHGVFNDSTPMYSHIALARAADEPDDGLLEAREIADLDLNADLVVLAGCDTARGHMLYGEGIVGMSWAFLAAGCPRTVVTQWKVGSASASELMIDFHRRLAHGRLSGRAVAESLRGAQLQMLGESARKHPFYWAGFIVMGDGW